MIPVLREAAELNDGFCFIADWVDGIVLRSPEIDRNHPDSAHSRFRNLPVNERIQALNKVFKLFTVIEENGFIIEDFYDGCTLYNFENRHIWICDLDHTHKGSYILERDRQYGSKRFMAPEEFIRGGIIDNKTNVYNLGAAAFEFLGNGNRNLDYWQDSKNLYDIAIKAVKEKKSERYSSVLEFYHYWIRAVKD